MKKGYILILLILLMFAFSTYGNGQKEQAGSLVETAKLVMAFRTFGTTPRDLSKIEEELNKILRDRIQAEVELLIIPSSSYNQQLTLMLSGNEQLDVIGANRALIPTVYAAEQIQPLGTLIDKYGQGIKAAIPDVLKNGYFEGELYCIPIQADVAHGYGGFMMRKDICDKYGIDPSAIDSYDKLTDVFALVQKNEPDMLMLAPYMSRNSFQMFNPTWDNLANDFGVLDHYGDNLKVVNLFETESYKNYLKVFRDWYVRGFISKDVTNATDAGASLMKAGNLFAYTQATKPGVEAQESNSSGYEVVSCQVLPTLTTTFNIWQWAIPENSDNPEKAMMLLNELYTNPDVINLMAYGIEGEHYAFEDDGTINYPAGVDSASSGYNMGNMVWSFGNEFIAHIWHGNSIDVWEQTKVWNKSGLFSKANGFVFNPLPVANEITAVQNIFDQYKMGLECGVLDPEKTLPEMNDKLYKAGLQKIIDEKQAQLNKWATQNNVK